MSQTQTQTSLLSCRWGWCAYTTTSPSDFSSHVLDGHVGKATAIKRSDIAAKRRVEDGQGESLSVFAPSISEGSSQSWPPNPQQNAFSPIVRSQSKSQEQPSSSATSLPMPPAAQPTRKFADLSSSYDSPSSQSEGIDEYQSPALESMIMKREPTPLALDLTGSGPSSQKQKKMVPRPPTQEKEKEDWYNELPSDDDPLQKSIGDLTIDPAFLFSHSYQSQDLAFQTQAPYHSQSSMYDNPV